MMKAYASYKIAIGPPVEAKLPPGDPRWPKFNASFTNRELTSLELADAVERGCPITTWHKNHWRTSKNYLLGQAIGLDFDTGDKRSELDFLMTDPFIWKYSGLLYSTPSHTPAAPRSRVMFLLDTPIHQASNYILAASALLWAFGTADRQCKDAVRFFYGGRPGACETRILDHSLPIALVKDLIARYRATGMQARRQANTTYAGTTPDEGRVIDALNHINAWSIDYDEWVAILMALHSEFPGANGLAIAESWADGKPGEVEQKWKSFNQTGNISGRVGIGTLFTLAKQSGWEAGT
jgi:hypothetical protein